MFLSLAAACAKTLCSVSRIFTFELLFARSRQHAATDGDGHNLSLRLRIEGFMSESFCANQSCCACRRFATPTFVDRQFQTAALRYLTPANASPPRIHRGEASASSGAPAMAARQRRRHASSGAPPSEVKGEFQNCVTDDDGRELETKSFCLLNFCAQHHIEFPPLL